MQQRRNIIVNTPVCPFCTKQSNCIIPKSNQVWNWTNLWRGVVNDVNRQVRLCQIQDDAMPLLALCVWNPRVDPSTNCQQCHYTDVTMSPMASQITSHGIVYSTVYSGADQRKHQSSASLAFVRRIHRRPVNSPHKRPVTRKMFSFDDVIMNAEFWCFRCC